MTMQAGKLKRSVTIQSKTESQDAYNAPIEAWSTFASRRMSIEPISGEEYWQAEQVDSSTTHVCGMRYLEGVTTGMRIVFGSRILEILSVIDTEERNRNMVLMCKEVTS